MTSGGPLVIELRGLRVSLNLLVIRSQIMAAKLPRPLQAFSGPEARERAGQGGARRGGPVGQPGL